MITAAKKISQVAAHMSVAFVIMYWMTGSAAFGGLAAVLEPVCNVILLPFHETAWRVIRRRIGAAHGAYTLLAAEKCSQLGMHMAVAFAIMYVATGSVAFGGLAAVLEPVCNVILLPFHDGMWERLRRKIEGGKAIQMAMA